MSALPGSSGERIGDAPLQTEAPDDADEQRAATVADLAGVPCLLQLGEGFKDEILRAGPRDQTITGPAVLIIGLLQNL